MESEIMRFHVQKWHPDKHKGDSAATEKFQEINEAYNGKSFFRIVGSVHGNIKINPF